MKVNKNATYVSRARCRAGEGGMSICVLLVQMKGLIVNEIAQKRQSGAPHCVRSLMLLMVARSSYGSISSIFGK
jgi:hypothetical protein